MNVVFVRNTLVDVEIRKRCLFVQNSRYRPYVTGTERLSRFGGASLVNSFCETQAARGAALIQEPATGCLD